MRSLSPRRLRLALGAFSAALLLASSARADAPEYKTAASTKVGKWLVAERTDASTLRAALQLTLTDLTHYFGAAPSVFRAFGDSKDPHSGGATFLVTFQGVQQKGLVTVKVGPTTKVAVAYIRADATAGQWAELVSPPAEPKPGAAAAASVPAASEAAASAHAVLQPYLFPDGTGSIGLAEGWSTKAQSGSTPVVLQGPQDQMLVVGGMYTVVTPASTLPRVPGGLVGRYGSAAEVFAELVPQFSQISAKRGGPTRTIDHLVTVDDPQHRLASRELTVLRYGVTETAPDGGSKHYQGMAWVGLGPVQNATFFFSLTTIRAPDATFEKDKPVMFQMLSSEKINAAGVARKSNAELAAQNERFAAQQRRMQAQQDANEKQHQQYWAGQKAKDAERQQYWDKQREQARTNDNFDEYIRGVRTVEDTKTGEKASVDLGNVTKIVDDLNERDPGRYKEIPLRDEAHP